MSVDKLSITNAFGILLMFIALFANCNQNTGEGTDNGQVQYLKKAKQASIDTTPIQLVTSVKDNIKRPSAIKTWADLKLYAKQTDNITYRHQNIDKSILAQLDTTIFGKYIQKTYALKSSYLLSVRPPFGNYYPCVIFVEQYDCDQLTSFIAVFMIDSTFNNTGDFEFISGSWEDTESSGDFYGTFDDSLLQIDKSVVFECEEADNNLSNLETEQLFKLTTEGKIEEIRIDTSNIEFCINNEAG